MCFLLGRAGFGVASLAKIRPVPRRSATGRQVSLDQLGLEAFVFGCS